MRRQVLGSVIAVGIALRLWQYLSDTSMWFDELSVARNVSERSLATAPLGFLAAVDVSSTVLAPSDLALRFFPLLCALSVPLIRYSAELKQYSGDAAVLLGLTLVALDLCARQPSARTCIVPGTIGCAAVVMKRPPYLVEQFKPVLAYVQAHRQARDQVYVYSNAYQAVARYGPRYGLTDDAYVLGVCNEREYRPFLEDVDRFRGARRVWLIASSVPDFYPARHGIVRYLQTIGIRRDSISLPSSPPMSPVSAELYDLSDTMRLRAAGAATFAVAAAMQR